MVIIIANMTIVSFSQVINEQELDDLMTVGSELICSLTVQSWTSEDGIYIPEGMLVPCAPNRRMHKRHVKNMESFLDKVEKRPQALELTVKLRRDLQELRGQLEEIVHESGHEHPRVSPPGVYLEGLGV